MYRLAEQSFVLIVGNAYCTHPKDYLYVSQSWLPKGKALRLLLRSRRKWVRQVIEPLRDEPFEDNNLKIMCLRAEQGLIYWSQHCRFERLAQRIAETGTKAVIAIRPEWFQNEPDTPGTEMRRNENYWAFTQPLLRHIYDESGVQGRHPADYATDT